MLQTHQVKLHVLSVEMLLKTQAEFILSSSKAGVESVLQISMKRVWPGSNFWPPCFPAHWITSIRRARSSGLSGIDMASVHVGWAVRARGTQDCGDSRITGGTGAFDDDAPPSPLSGWVTGWISGVRRVRFRASLCMSAPCGSFLCFSISIVYPPNMTRGVVIQ